MVNAIFHRDRIVRATLGADPAMLGEVADPESLGQIAAYLHDCETAFDILRKRGYGEFGTSIIDMANAVPKAS